MTTRGSDLTLHAADDGVAFWIHVTPRARRESVGGTHGEALRIAVSAPPLGGEANAACVRALARALGVGRAAVDLDPASRGRRKRVRVRGDPARLRSRLEELGGSAGELARAKTSD